MRPRRAGVEDEPAASVFSALGEAIAPNGEINGVLELYGDLLAVRGGTESRMRSYPDQTAAGAQAHWPGTDNYCISCGE